MFRRLLIYVLVSSLVLVFFVPMVAGARFTGHFWPDAIWLGVLYALIKWLLHVVIEMIRGLIEVVLGATAYIAASLGFLLAPALAFRLLALVNPAHLWFGGWASAILIGLATFALSLTLSALAEAL